MIVLLLRLNETRLRREALHSGSGIFSEAFSEARSNGDWRGDMRVRLVILEQEVVGLVIE